MSIKSILPITLLIVFVFVVSPVSAEENKSNSNAAEKQREALQQKLQNTSQTPGTNTAPKPTVIPERIKEEVTTQIQETRRNYKEIQKERLAELEQKRKEVQTQYRSEAERIKALKEQNKQEYEVLRERFSEKSTVNREKIVAQLDEIKLKRLEKIKDAAARVEARLKKAAEYLYTYLGKMEQSVMNNTSPNFDSDTYMLKISNIKEKITATEVKISQFGPLYENIEERELTEMGQSLAELQRLASSIKKDFQDIRMEIRTIGTEMSRQQESITVTPTATVDN